ncbi:helix-turn-helix domain-containing protein [Pseudogulbenkiania sp. MAI-1]|uniref:helix-turn-helix domain-containing protein n=1 Tax=Pseudogulbenkiania sp. MAI-1 TaxID=990370 RepID=UPI00045EC0F0|nr:helix-turn-helix domain-containing protein [Pseudogulbenkiania sp. MAI-1]
MSDATPTAQHLAEHDGQLPDPSAEAQRQRLLVALRQGPVTTLQARRLHDVLHPAARVQELRERGNRIITCWVTDNTSEGRPHRVAKYVLTTEASPHLIPRLDR